MSDKTVFKWPIVQFSRTASRDNPRYTLNSNVFTLNGSNAKFYLRFYPTNVNSKYSDQYCSLSLMPQDFDGAAQIKLEYKFWIENNRGEKLKWKLSYNSYKFSKINIGTGSREFVHHDLLYSPQSDFVKDDFIFICCELRPLLPKTEENIQEVMDVKEWELFVGGFADWCTIQVGDREFKIGKSKLMAYSSVFEVMFKSDVKEVEEAQTGIVKMNDTTATAIEAMIKYLYTQKVKATAKDALELYVLADKYDIDGLKKSCSRILVKKLNSNNAFVYLTLSINHNDQVLKQKVLDYMTANLPIEKFKKAILSDQWINLLKVDKQIAREIVDEVFKASNWH